MTEFVKVKFQGTIEAGVSGTLNIPKEIWNDKPDNAFCSDAAAQFINENFDWLMHLTDLDGDIELDFVKEVDAK